MDGIKDNETAQKLISTALELFKKQGYEETPITQVCDAVGIAKNTFYYYFKSKDDLLLACMRNQKTLDMGEVTAILLSGRGYFEQFWAMQKPQIDFVQSCGSEIMRNISHSHTSKDEALYGKNEERQKVETAVLEKAREAGEISGHIAPHLLSICASIQFLGLLALWVSMNGAFDFEKALRSSFETFFDLKPELRQGGDLYAQLVSGREYNKIESRKRIAVP
jgi:AcrR family transcriptional regulator